MSQERRSHAPEIKRALWNPQRVLEALGVFGEGKNRRRQGKDGWVICCPMHADRTPSLSVQVVDGELAWRCHGSCGVGGDVLSLIAGVRGLRIPSDFPQVLLEAARIGGLWHIVDELEGRERVEPRPIAPPEPPRQGPEAPRMYPDGIEAFWGRLEPVSADSEVVAYLAGRKIDPDRVEVGDWARVLPDAGALPTWARCRGGSWREASYRLVVPVFDAEGIMRSVRGWRVGGDHELPKRIPPVGHKANGLVLADTFGLAMLRGTRDPERVVITEGEPDTLLWSTRSNDPKTAILGVLSGSWSDAFAARIPIGCDVCVRTHLDRAGDKYAAEIERSLRRRAFVWRLQNSLEA